ncbi:hypothetical protein [Gemmatimonas groenlandica]|uniref:Uncharacterized protein n=1 Tax=Gemmatimonas groenlandica TaxID=2732249 RepID=A0A6M4ISM2_9BACT|nr:hypothetical protein [Gemmatimonas groenlandica]QJR37078.1 hypothetical protein HKW67_16915 [Gemmatimonas groenlandica]
MSDIMSHKQWMSLTHGGYTSVRSSQLKAVDTALAKYDGKPTDANKAAVTAALLKWIQSKGAAWKSSERNKKQGVEILHHQLMGTGGVKLSGAEMVGLSHVRDESRAIVHDLFAGKQLQWRSEFKAKLGQQKIGVTLGVGGALYGANTLSNGAIRNAPSTIKTAVLGSSGGPSMAEEIYRTVVPPEILADVTFEVTKLMPTFMKDLAASVTPWVGLITTGGGVVLSGVKALRGQWRAQWAEYHIEGSLARAEPSVALRQIHLILERERNLEVTGMGIGLAEFGGKLAGVLADGGTATNVAIGLAASVTKLLNIVRIIVRDVLERNAANAKMKGQVDVSVFEACPIVGAYLLCCAPTSVIVNSIFDNQFGAKGWQSQVENAVTRHLVPLKVQAQRLVTEHRFWIPELYRHHGVLEVNSKKLKEMMERKGKTGMVGFGSDNMPASLRS